VKVDKKSLKVVEDEEYDDISVEDLVEGMCTKQPSARRSKSDGTLMNI
jgi:hypothetical protein